MKPIENAELNEWKVTSLDGTSLKDCGLEPTSSNLTLEEARQVARSLLPRIQWWDVDPGDEVETRYTVKNKRTGQLQTFEILFTTPEYRPASEYRPEETDARNTFEADFWDTLRA